MRTQSTYRADRPCETRAVLRLDCTTRSSCTLHLVQFRRSRRFRRAMRPIAGIRPPSPHRTTPRIGEPRCSGMGDAAGARLPSPFFAHTRTRAPPVPTRHTHAVCALARPAGERRPLLRPESAAYRRRLPSSRASIKHAWRTRAWEHPGLPHATRIRLVADCALLPARAHARSAVRICAPAHRPPLRSWTTCAFPRAWRPASTSWAGAGIASRATRSGNPART